MTGWFFAPLYIVLVIKTYRKKQRETRYNLHKTTCFTVILLVFKIDKVLRHQLLSNAKMTTQNFLVFENNYDTLLCEDGRAFHATSCGVFYFSSDNLFSWWNDEITKIWFDMCQKSYLIRMMEVWPPKFCPV